MKLIITVALLAGLTIAAPYAPGAPCNTNIDCNFHCLKSQWTIAAQDTGYAFVCDPSLIDTTQYYTAACYSNKETDSASSYAYDAGSTSVACTALGGRMCSNGCVLVGKTSTTEQVQISWTRACSDDRADKNDFNEQGSSKDEAERVAGCDA